MPVTFTQTPQIYTPSDNPIMYVFAYDYYGGEYNHVFKLSVSIDGTLIGTFEYFPVLNNIAQYSGYIDVSNIVKSYINKVTTDSNTILSDAGNYGNVSITANCWYSTNANDPAIDQSEYATDSSVYAFKGCLGAREFTNWNYAGYMVGASNRKFLTDNTNNVELRESDETYLQIITDTIDSKVETILYSSAGSVIATDIMLLTGYKITQLKYSTDLLETIFTAPQVASASYFTIQLKNSITSAISFSELKRININRDGCFNGKNLVWLNKFGAYDSFLFTYNNILKSDIQSKSYGKRLGSFDGITFVNNPQDTGSLTYLKTITDKIQIVSDWLTQAEQNFVVQVYESPLVYINESTLYENIEIENSSYQFKQAEHEELFNEIIDAKFTHSRKSINL
jgi:hypothetical protein